jgi:methionine-rich copper-binding protein CopC
MQARTTLPRRLLLPGLLLLVLLGAASPAAAHTRLTGSTPAAGAEVTASTTEVVLSFTGTVREAFSTVVVTGPDGADVAAGPPVLRGSDVVQELEGPLATGAWTVAYRVVAGDGHPITGTLAFTVAAADEPAAPAALPSPSPSPAAAAPLELSAATDEDSSLLLPTSAALLVTAGAGALVLRRRAPRSGRA